MQKDKEQQVQTAKEPAKTVHEPAKVGLPSCLPRFQDLVEQALVGIYVIQDDKFVYVNPKFENIFGYAADEILAFTSVSDLVVEQDRAVFTSILARSIRENTSIHQKLSCRRKDRVLVDIEFYGTIADFDNKPALIGSLLDITERKRMESELYRAQKLESIGILAGGIAHEFNNILTAINGNILLAKMYAKPGLEVFDILAEAEKGCKRAEDLTKQLLTFAKGGTLFRKVFSPKQLLSEIAAEITAGSRVQCSFSIAEDLWSIEADEGQIRQALSNVFVNAKEAMGGKGRIELSARNIPAGGAVPASLREGSYVMISISDQGPGIDEKLISKIFDPFFTTKEKASGLGLTTAFSIIVNHDGEIRVESQPGSGATFHIYFRAYFGETRVISQEKRVSLGGRKRILVMDDEEIVRNVVERMLDQFGCVVTFACDGNEMLEAYGKAMEFGEPFDAVIVDLIISGGMGGKEAIGKLLALDPGAKAIVSSGYSDDPILSDFEKYGFKGVLAKPYRISELGRVLKGVISGEAQ